MISESFQYPVKWSRVAVHHKANKISKQPAGDDENLGMCECCYRKVGVDPKFTLMENVEEKYGQWGPNVVFYFESIKKIMVLLVLGVMVFTCYTMYANINGTFCVDFPDKCQFNHIVYLWSIYNIILDRDALFTQLVLWSIVSLVVLFFNVYLRIYFIKNYERINNKNITDADFSIIVRRLPRNTQISDLYKLVTDLIKDVQSDKLNHSALLKIRNIIMIYKMKEPNKVQAENTKKFKQAIKDHQLRDFVEEDMLANREFAKCAIIRFDSIHANEVLKIKTSFFERAIRYFFPFVNPRTKYRVKGKRVAIEQAPEPTDIIWDHFGYSEIGKIKRKILFTSLGILTLFFSGGVMYGLAIANNAITDEQGNVPIYFSILMVLFPYAFNYIIGMLLVSATNRHRLDNKTEQYIEQMQKIVLYQSINLGFFSLFLPFIVKLPDIRSGVQSLSLPYVIFMSSLTQSFVSPTTSFVFRYFGLYPRVWKFLIKHNFLTMTQTEANSMFEGPHIEFSSNYITLIKTVWFSFLFAVVSPISLPINLVGLIYSYLLQKIMLNRRYVIPQYGGSRLNSEFVDLLDLTPLFISLLNIFLHFISAQIFEEELQYNIKVMLFLNLGIGLLIALIPWGQIVEGCDYKIRAENNFLYDQVKGQIEITYEQLNPFTQEKIKVRNIDRRWGNRSKFQEILKSKVKGALFTERNFLWSTGSDQEKHTDTKNSNPQNGSK